MLLSSLVFLLFLVLFLFFLDLGRGREGLGAFFFFCTGALAFCGDFCFLRGGEVAGEDPRDRRRGGEDSSRYRDTGLDLRLPVRVEGPLAGHVAGK